MTTMKRVLALLLALTMTLSLAACGVQKAQPGAEQPGTEPTAEVLPVDTGKQTSDADTALSREDKELVADLVGGQDGSRLTDEELDALIDQLVNEVGGDTTTSDDRQTQEPTIDVPLDPGAYDEDGAMKKPFDEVYPELIEENKVAFSGESILVKLESDTLTEGLKTAGIGALDKIVPPGRSGLVRGKAHRGNDPQGCPGGCPGPSGSPSGRV